MYFVLGIPIIQSLPSVFKMALVKCVNLPSIKDSLDISIDENGQSFTEMIQILEQVKANNDSPTINLVLTCLQPLNVLPNRYYI